VTLLGPTQCCPCQPKHSGGNDDRHYPGYDWVFENEVEGAEHTATSTVHGAPNLLQNDPDVQKALSGCPGA
jgi:hypothetical protein